MERYQRMCSRCHQSCQRGMAPHAWSGHALGLSSISLRYPTPGDETGFIMSCSDKLCRLWYYAMIIYVVVCAYWTFFLYDKPDDNADPAYPVILFQLSSRIATCFAAVLHITVISIPRLLQHMTAAVREKAVVIMVLCIQVTGFDKYYVAKLFGFSDPILLFPDLDGYTDSPVLLYFCSYLVVSHFLPVRWALLLAIEVLAVVMYGTAIFILGSPEPQSKMCFAHFVLLVLFIAIGKRQSEVNDRLLFTSFLAEKGMRMQAEFQLSQATSSTRDSRRNNRDDDDCSSFAPTTATGEAFVGLDSMVESISRLESIWEIGRREQWLIDEQELDVYPHICLGSGGFGVVIAGGFHGTPVALKLHIRTGSTKPLHDIGNELRLLRKLRHPNIVLLHGACLSVQHKDLVLVMEHVRGDSMVDFIGRQPTADKRWKSLMDTCQALMYLHSRYPPIVHGDLKPANIIVESHSTDVHVKLLDFGLARLVTRSATPGGGTYRWMAPTVLGPTGAVRVEDDVYAFGLVMYFAATSEMPFAELSEATLKAHVRGEEGGRRSLSWPGHTSGFATQCKSLVDRCIHLLREQRPSMARVGEALRGFEVGRSRDAPTLQPCPPNSMGLDLWSQLSLVRHVTAHKLESERKWSRLAKVHMDQTSSTEPKHLASVPEEDAEHDAARVSVAASACRYPSLSPTPTTTMMKAILEALGSWNEHTAPDCCCELHASLQLITNLCKELSEQACMPVRLVGSHIYQCPSCQMLKIVEKEECLTQLSCFWCGYDGPPGLDVVP